MQTFWGQNPHCLHGYRSVRPTSKVAPPELSPHFLFAPVSGRPTVNSPQKIKPNN